MSFGQQDLNADEAPYLFCCFSGWASVLWKQVKSVTHVMSQYLGSQLTWLFFSNHPLNLFFSIFHCLYLLLLTCFRCRPSNISLLNSHNTHFPVPLPRQCKLSEKEWALHPRSLLKVVPLQETIEIALLVYLHLLLGPHQLQTNQPPILVNGPLKTFPNLCEAWDVS